MLMSTATMRAPAFAIATAIAAPIPEPAPVTSAILPSNKPAMIYAAKMIGSRASRPARCGRDGRGSLSMHDRPPLRPQRTERRTGELDRGGRLLCPQRPPLGDRRRLRRLQRIAHPAARPDRIRQVIDPAVAAPDVVAVGLSRVAVDERPRVERVRHAAHFVFDREQHLAGVEVDDVLEAVLAAVALLGDQVELCQPVVRPAEILDIDLQMVAVERLQLLVGLAKDQALLDADRHIGGLALAIALDLGLGAEDFAIEAADAHRAVGRHGKLDKRNPEIDLAKTLDVRLVETELVAPRAGRPDVIVVFLELELGVLEVALDALKAVQKLLAVRRDDADMAAEHQGLAGRHMDLALADVDPHVVGAGEQIRVAGEAAAHQIEIARQRLVRDFDVQMFEKGDVAEALGIAVKRVLHRVSSSIPQQPAGDRLCATAAPAEFVAIRTGFRTSRPPERDSRRRGGWSRSPWRPRRSVRRASPCSCPAAWPPRHAKRCSRRNRWLC